MKNLRDACEEFGFKYSEVVEYLRSNEHQLISQPEDEEAAIEIPLHAYLHNGGVNFFSDNNSRSDVHPEISSELIEEERIPSCDSAEEELDVSVRILHSCDEQIIPTGGIDISGAQSIREAIIACESLDDREKLYQLAIDSLRALQKNSEDTCFHVAAVFAAHLSRELHQYTRDMTPEFYEEIQRIRSDDQICMRMNHLKGYNSALSRWSWILDTFDE
jgi:hypothetical protein